MSILMKKHEENKIIVHLVEEYLGEHLISRSIARRILSNIEKFKIVFLDFNGVKIIGQAFADEIFRVFRNKQKEITILPINMNEEVKFMIKRVDKNIVME
ncbi:STAS-like domain-containing protein [Fusobacterium polymorphum]|nr:STAS-like domain-containing protein [Fusobacterium polymorphum]